MSLNHIRPWRNIYRRTSRQIMVGNVPVGGDAPISVQTMTNTDTSDARATIAQVLACAEAGADIVRVSTPDEALMTDVGFTGGGAGSGMVYLAGKQSHKLSNAEMVDHIVEQVEARAALIEAEAQSADQAAE